MIVSADSKIRVKLLIGEEEVYLTLDGQRGDLLVKNDVVDIKQAPFELQLVSSPKRNYFGLLKEKLGWGGK